MSEFPTSAKVVVVGAGIVGNCLVGHLSDLGWTDMVLLDKGPLPNPGGSTVETAVVLEREQQAGLGGSAPWRRRTNGEQFGSGG